MTPTPQTINSQIKQLRQQIELERSALALIHAAREDRKKRQDNPPLDLEAYRDRYTEILSNVGREEMLRRMMELVNRKD